MKKVICVYSSSSNTIDTSYFDLAAELGRAIASNGDTLLFGGGMRGLMGATATAAHDSGARVIGIIPEALNLKGIAFEACDEMVVTRDIRTRKAIMDERSEAFIALPGGFGTLEELIEIISLKLLKYHNKPIVIMNRGGFYDAMLKQFEDIIEGSFAKPESRTLYYVAADAADAMEYINSYKPVELKDKWLT